MVNKDDMLRVGVIANTHGVHGEVKVFPTTDDVNRFKELKSVYLDLGKDLVELEITGVKFFKNMAILKFKGYDNMNDVERWKQKDLLITRDQAVPLAPGEYFICDLIGLEVYSDTDSEHPVGTLTEVLQTAANDVYIITKKDGKEILVPYVADFDIKVDLENRRCSVHFLPGSLE